MTTTNGGAKLKIVLLTALLAWVVVAATDRLMWVNAQGGLLGYIGADVGVVELPGCEHRAVEFKATTDGHAVVYRCSTNGAGLPIWPFLHSGESKELPAALATRFGRQRVTPNQ